MLGFIKKLKIRNKIVLSYIPIILAPCLLFFFFSNQTVKNYFQNHLMTSAKKSCEQTLDNLNQKTTNLSSILYILASNPIVEEATSADFSTMTYYQQYNLERRIEQTFLGIIEQNNIDNIKIFMPKGFQFNNMTNTGDFEEIKQTEWYRIMLQDKKALLCEKSIEDENYISIGKLIYEKNNFTSFISAIKLYINEEDFQNVLKKNVISNNGLCYICNEYGEIITCSDYDMLDKYKLPDETLSRLIKSKQWTDLSNTFSKNVYASVYEIDYSGCYLVNILNESSITDETNRLNKRLVIYIIIAMICSYIFAYFISFSIDRRIIRLNKAIKMAHNGSLKPIDISGKLSGSNDEIDILSDNYNKMVERLETALKTQYENGKIIKSSELKILYEQINPHFLYNVLDLINWMAINNETQNISKTVTMLANYYKLSLNKGKELLSISDELRHVKLYFDIQKIRFENIKQINIDVPNEILPCNILKTVFQPLLENFIIHGMTDDMEGVFSIKADIEENNIIFTVSDNGTGISKDTIEAINNGTFISASGSGFGLKSLDSRLKIFYGDEYGLSFGDCSEGAVIYIKIPYTHDK